MKTVNLNTGLVESLVGEIVSRIAEGTPGVKDTTLPREALKRFRATTSEDREAWGIVATDADADLLEKLLDGEEASEPALTPPDPGPLTLTLPPRLAAAVRLEALQCSKSIEEHLLYALADMHRDNVSCYDGDERRVLWLTEGTCAEPRARAAYNRWSRRMACREEVAS